MTLETTFPSLEVKFGGEMGSPALGIRAYGLWLEYYYLLYLIGCYEDQMR